MTALPGLNSVILPLPGKRLRESPLTQVSRNTTMNLLQVIANGKLRAKKVAQGRLVQKCLPCDLFLKVDCISQH